MCESAAAQQHLALFPATELYDATLNLAILPLAKVGPYVGEVPVLL